MAPPLPMPPATRDVLARAARYYQEGHVRRALDLCCEALVQQPGEARLAALAGSLAGELGELDRAIGLLRHAARLVPGQADIQFNLGVALERSGDRSAAAEAYRQAVAAAPGSGEAWFALARLLEMAGRASEALAAFRRVLDIDPAHAGARHMTAALSGDNPEAPPEGYVRALFDDYARQFDDALVTGLQYGTPEMLSRLISEAAPDRRFERALDLGCGTGLAGGAIAAVTGHLEGIDLSPGMVARARQRGIYAALHVGDIGDHLRASAGCGRRYDLVLAADVLVYVGDLDPLFAAVAACLSPDGLFAFSVERLEVGTFRLQPSGRYAHAEPYVADLASRHRLGVRSMGRGILRRDHGRPVDGTLYILAPA